MRLVIQRVTEAAVHIGGVCAGSTGPGLMILAGIEEADTEEDVRWLAKKAADTVTYGNGMRGSAPYRRALAETLVRRAALSLMEQEAE